MWKEANKWEAEWWGDCINTYGEEVKQLTYAKKMGLTIGYNSKSPVVIDMQGKSVLDVGGGPVSLLLKCVNVEGFVVDPLPVPSWVVERYKCAGIQHSQKQGEQIEMHGFDEVWIYNVLQHTDDPQKIISNMRKAGKIIRMFEWIETRKTAGHPQVLTEEKLNDWLDGIGKVEVIQGNPSCSGKCYYGIFKGDNYEEA